MTLVNLQGAPQAFSEDDSNVADHNDCQPHDLQAAAWWLLGDRAHVGMEDEGEIVLINTFISYKPLLPLRGRANWLPRMPRNAAPPAPKGPLPR